MGYQDPGCIHGGHSLGHTYNLCWLHFLSCLQVRPFGGTDMPACLPSPKSWTQTLKAGSSFRDDQIRVSFLASGRMREDEVTPNLVDFELEPSSVCPSSDSRRRQKQDLTKDSFRHPYSYLPYRYKSHPQENRQRRFYSDSERNSLSHSFPEDTG